MHVVQQRNKKISNSYFFLKSYVQREACFVELEGWAFKFSWLVKRLLDVDKNIDDPIGDVERAEEKGEQHPGKLVN